MENSVQTSDEEILKDALLKLKWGADYIVEALDKIPKSLKDTVEDSCEYNYKTLAKKISSAIDDVKKFEEAILSEREIILSSLDETWTQISKKHELIQEKIKKIQGNKIEVDTYRMKEILDLLNKLENYSPETWKRFEVICSKLSA